MAQQNSLIPFLFPKTYLILTVSITMVQSKWKHPLCPIIVHVIYLFRKYSILLPGGSYISVFISVFRYRHCRSLW